MDDNHPNTPDSDAEYDAIKGLIPGLDDVEDESKEEIEEEEQTQTEEEPEEESTEEEEAEEEQETTQPDPEDEEEEEENTPPKRPEKYIPVQKYTSEKNAWKTEREALEKELEALRKGNTEQQDDAIKAYADKHGVTEESVRELFGLLGKGDKRSDEEREAALDEETRARLDRADELEAEKLFDDEFTNLAVPKLKKLYPNATDAQIRSAKKELEKLATTSEFLSTPLDKIVLASQEELSPLMQEKPNRKGPESGRQAPKRGDTQFTADDFKNGKTSFAELTKLSVEQQTKIIDEMDMQTYDQYSRFVERNEPVVINRGGRKIRT